MWRKPTDPKPSSPRPDARPEVPPAPGPLPVPAQFSPAPVAAPPVPAPAAVPVAPAYSAPVTKVVTHNASGGTSIGSGLKIRGELSGSSDLYIDGETQGKITLADSKVTVGVNGRVQADIEAREIIIEGTIQGNLKARETVHLGPSSRVQGSILTARIGIDDGARLRGKVEMTRAGEPKSSRPSAPEKPVAVSAYKTVSAATESE
jgi:cytoskeletal protein CcmA (bactofilin family)